MSFVWCANEQANELSVSLSLPSSSSFSFCWCPSVVEKKYGVGPRYVTKSHDRHAVKKKQILLMMMTIKEKAHKKQAKDDAKRGKKDTKMVSKRNEREREKKASDFCVYFLVIFLYGLSFLCVITVLLNGHMNSKRTHSLSGSSFILQSSTAAHIHFERVHVII